VSGAVVTPDGVRGELREWVRRHWDPDRTLVEWRTELAGAGWAAPSWPARWSGRDLPVWADDLVAAELRRLGAVGAPLGTGMLLVGPTLLAHAGEDLRDRFLRPILTGTEAWCQLFSEPGAGSDLAGLTSSAVADGDEWIVNGQKLWTTGAARADMAILLARTDWDVPKHRGITFFLLPMHQAGVTVRPLKQMNYHQSFNEVFLTDARIPRGSVVGAVGDGWGVAMTTLAHERRFGVAGRPRFDVAAGRVLEEAAAEADAHFATYRWYPQRAGRADLLVEEARRTGTSADARVRQAVGAVLAQRDGARWTAERGQAVRALGRPPGPEGSVGKLSTSAVARAAAHAHALIAGASGMLSGEDGPLDGLVAEILTSVPAQSIAGGTDEIQRNILAERVLGLPREPAVDRDVVFRQVRR